MRQRLLTIDRMKQCVQIRPKQKAVQEPLDFCGVLQYSSVVLDHTSLGECLHMHLKQIFRIFLRLRHLHGVSVFILLQLFPVHSRIFHIEHATNLISHVLSFTVICSSSVP